MIEAFGQGIDFVFAQKTLLGTKVIQLIFNQMSR